MTILWCKGSKAPTHYSDLQLLRWLLPGQRNLKTRWLAPHWCFTSNIFWTNLPLLSGVKLGREPPLGFQRYWNTQESKWGFCCFDGCFSAKPWKCAEALGLLWCDADSITAWLWVNLQEPPRGPSAGLSQSVTTTYWWLSNTTYDLKD